MKFIIHLFNTFNCFRGGVCRPLFSIKPIIIFSNINPKKKDWEQTIHNYWNPMLLEIQTVMNPAEQTFFSPRVALNKVKKISKVAGLFEIRNFIL